MEIKDLVKNIYNFGEEYIPDILENFKNNAEIDKTLTYIFIKAFYMHCVKLYLFNNKKMEIFDELYNEYKNVLIEYYRNDYEIPNELIEEIKNAFDKSYEMVESLNFNDIDDSYEFRHHIIIAFGLLRNILERKSKSAIREDVFDNYISKIKTKSEEIIDYIESNL